MADLEPRLKSAFGRLARSVDGSVPDHDELLAKARRRRAGRMFGAASVALAIVALLGILTLVDRDPTTTVALAGRGSEPTTTTVVDIDDPAPAVLDGALTSSTTSTTTRRRDDLPAGVTTTTVATATTVPDDECPAPVATYPTGLTSPGRLSLGGDGRVWFASGSDATVGAVTRTGVVTTYSVPGPRTNAYLPARGPDGTVWFAEHSGTRVWSVTSDGRFDSVEFPHQVTAMASASPDGRLWYVFDNDTTGEGVAARSSDGTTKSWDVGSPVDAEYRGIVDLERSSDGVSLWFGQSATNKFGRITTSGEITEYDGLPDRQGANAGPHVVVPSGGDVWFLATNADGSETFGRRRANGSITDLRRLDALDLAAGPDGTIWITTGTPKLLALRTDGSIDEYTTDGDTWFVIIASDGRPWFTTKTAVGTVRDLPPCAD